MSTPGFDPTFNPSGSTSTGGSVPDPGSVAGTARFLREDATFAAPFGTVPPGPPPPAPGPALDQWACDVAGYLVYAVVRSAVKIAVDAVDATIIGDVTSILLAGLLDALLPEAIVLDPALETAIIHWVSTFIATNITAFAALVIDDVLWSKIHCFMYDAIKATPGDLAAALTLVASVKLATIMAPGATLTGLAYIMEHLGITSIADIPLTALVKHYDCSTCATTGEGPTPGLAQVNFDLTVTDDTTTDTFVSAMEFPQAVVSASPTPQRAIVNTKALVIQQVSADYTMLDTDDMVEADTGGGGITITLPPASGTVKLRWIANTGFHSLNEVQIMPAFGDGIGNTGDTSSGVAALQKGEEGYALINDGANRWRIWFGSQYALARNSQYDTTAPYYPNQPPRNEAEDFSNLQSAIETGAAKVEVLTADATIDVTKDLHLIDATAGAITLTLPDGLDAFKLLSLVRLDGVTAHTITLATTGGATIGGVAAPRVILPLQGDGVLIASDQMTVSGDTVANWIIVAQAPSAIVVNVTATAPLTSSAGETPNISLADQDASTFLAGPAIPTDPPSHPTFRTIVSTDLAASPTDGDMLESISGMPFWTPKPSDYFLGESVNGGGVSSSEIGLTSIPNRFRHLRGSSLLFINSPGGGGSYTVYITLNSSTLVSGHNWVEIGGGPGSINSDREITETGIQIATFSNPTDADYPLVIDFVIPYAQPGTFKRSIHGTASVYSVSSTNILQLFGGQVPVTAPVDQVALVAFLSGTIVQPFGPGSRLSLYGVL